MIMLSCNCEENSNIQWAGYAIAFTQPVANQSGTQRKSGLCVKGWLQANVVYMLGTFELYVAWELRMQDLVEYKDLGKTLMT